MTAAVQTISSHSAAPNGAKNQPFVVDHALGVAVAGGASPQTVAVTWPGGLPAGYQVAVTPSMKPMTWVTNRTATGFTVNLDNGGTNSADTINVLVVSA
jgi:hypothetical protein